MEGQLPDGRSARSHGLTLLPRQASPLEDDPLLPVHSRGPPNSAFQSPDPPRLEAIRILRGVGRKESPVWMERLLCAERELRPSDVR